MENYVRLFAFCLLLVIVTTSNPGFRTKITRQALQYANSVAMDKFSRQITKEKLPSFEGKNGRLEFNVHNVQVRTFNKPSSSLTTQSDGIHWSASNAGMKVTADFGYKYKLLFTIRGGCSIDVDIGGLSFYVVIVIQRLPNGTLTSRSVRCNADIGSVSVKFHGRGAWFYNWFRGKVARSVKDSLRPQICKSLQDLINKSGSKALAKLKLTVKLGRKFILDYSLNSNITYTSAYLESNHKGEVFWYSNRRRADVSNPPLPVVTDNSKMIYFWLSEYVISTLMWQAQNNNFLTYTFTRNDLEPNQTHFLNVTCKNSLCVGDLFPQIQGLYPGYYVDVYMRSSFTPKVKILAGKIHGELGGEIDLYAVKAGSSSRHFICRFSANMSADASMRVQNELLYGNMRILSFKLALVTRQNTTTTPSRFDDAMTKVVQQFVNKKVNNLMETGVPLPVQGKVQLIYPSLQLLPNAAVISSNLKYL